jgi:copper homeostasis protein (lipoprotein)
MTVKAYGAVLLLLVSTAADRVGAQQPSLLTGTITYKERVALPPTAVVEVRLEDVSRADAVPPVVARTRIDKPGQVPIRFNLDVDPSLVNARGRYAVRATIKDGETALFTSLDTALVLTQGHGTRVELVLTRVGSAKPLPQVDVQPPAPALPPNPFTDLPATFSGTLACADCDGIRYHLNLFRDDSFVLHMTPIGKAVSANDDLGSWAVSSDRRVLVLQGRGDEPLLFAIHAGNTLRRLDADGRPVTGKPAHELKRSTFQPVDVRAPMKGAYTSLADTATFLECSTGQRWPVAQEGVNRELESAYAKMRPAPGAAVLVEVDGLATGRPRMEGQGPQTTLVVERIRRVLPKESCAPRFASAPLADTLWRLTHLGDRVVPSPTDRRREPSLTFTAEGSSFSGSSGCNRLIGTYVVSNATMTMKSGGTMMACKDEMKTEAAFLSALQATRTYRIMGRVLELMDAKGVRVARFEARMPTGITVR